MNNKRPRGAEWTPEADEKFSALLKQLGHCWKKIEEELVRMGEPFRSKKQCERRSKELQIREEFHDKRGRNWSADEDSLLFEGYRVHGRKWSRFKANLPGRTADSMKNRFVELERSGRAPQPTADPFPGISSTTSTSAVHASVAGFSADASPEQSPPVSGVTLCGGGPAGGGWPAEAAANAWAEGQGGAQSSHPALGEGLRGMDAHLAAIQQLLMGHGGHLGEGSAGVQGASWPGPLQQGGSGLDLAAPCAGVFGMLPGLTISPPMEGPGMLQLGMAPSSGLCPPGAGPTAGGGGLNGASWGAAQEADQHDGVAMLRLTEGLPAHLRSAEGLLPSSTLQVQLLGVGGVTLSDIAPGEGSKLSLWPSLFSRFQSSPVPQHELKPHAPPQPAAETGDRQRQPPWHGQQQQASQEGMAGVPPTEGLRSDDATDAQPLAGPQSALSVGGLRWAARKPRSFGQGGATAVGPTPPNEPDAVDALLALAELAYRQ